MPGGPRSGPSRVHPISRMAALALVVFLLVPSLPLLDLVPDARAQGGAPENLLLNPGFERGYDEPLLGMRPSGWDPSTYRIPSGGAMRQDSTWAKSGSYSVMIRLPEGQQGRDLYWYQRQSLNAHQDLPFGGWVRADLEGGSEVTLRLRLLDDRGRELEVWEVSSSVDVEVWSELRYEEGAVPIGAVRLSFECGLQGPGTVWFDDVWVGTPSDVGNPPIIVSVPPLEAGVGTEYTYQARAVDLDGDGIIFHLARGPEGMTVDTGGRVSWTPLEVPVEAVKVVLAATDEGNHTTYQDFFLQVLGAPVVRPVHVLLLAPVEDHVNGDIAHERFSRVLPMVEALRETTPELGASVTVLLSGADAVELMAQLASGDPSSGWDSTAGLLDRGLEEGWMEVGYSAFHEPTYGTSPLYDPSYAGWGWSDRVSSWNRLLSRERDPLTGMEMPSGKGGVQAVKEALGKLSSVAGIGADGAQLHALARYDPGAVVLAYNGRPSWARAAVVDPDLGLLVSMLSEDPGAPMGAYWWDGRLRLAVEEGSVPVLAARDGQTSLETALAGLDTRRTHVIPVLVADPGMYCNASQEVAGAPVGSPTEWAYDHPGSPDLPQEAIHGEDLRRGLYETTCSTLDWLVSSLLPSTGGRFVDASGLARMVDPGAGLTVSRSELAAAANDLLARRVALSYPDWVGTSWGYCRGDYQYLSLADMYGLLVQALAGQAATGELPASLEMASLRGPWSEAPPSQPWQRVRLQDVVSGAAALEPLLPDQVWRETPVAVVPASTELGGGRVNAMEFLLLMAEVYLALHEGEGDEDSFIYVYPTLQWPVVHSVMAAEGREGLPGDSWDIKPVSSNRVKDDEAPVVRYVSPSNGATKVPLSSNVTVTFSERMDENPDPSDALVLDPPVTADVRWEYHRLVLDPREELRENTTYTATVRRVLTDAAGNPLASEVSWSFSTVGLENQPPTLVPWPSEDHMEVLENRTVRLGVLAVDDGPPPLRYSWLVDGIPVDGEEGDSLVFSTSYTDAGEHAVTVVVSDGADPPAEATFTWTVSVVNVNLPPVLLEAVPPAGPVEVLEEEDGELRLRVRAEDPDEGLLRFNWTVNGTAVPEDDLDDGGAVLVLRYDHDSAGNHSVTCLVSDRIGPGPQVEWTVVVVDVNRAPAILGVLPALPPTLELGERQEVVVNASDPDGDVLTYHWSVDGAEVSSTAQPGFEYKATSEGTHLVSVRVDDGRGGVDEVTVTINVLPYVESPPGPSGGSLPWLLLALAVSAAIVLALVWPLLRDRWGRRSLDSVEDHRNEKV